MGKIKRILLIGFLIALLLYTRFINISWGLPYLMHPDERNMAWALMKLNPSNFFKPGFFAYGQFPLYLGYIFVKIYHFLFNKVDFPINIVEATIALRIISATASVINAFLLLKIISLLNLKLKIKNFPQITNNKLLITSLIIILSPFFIQFSHFGTTESLLMLCYSLIVYLAILFVSKKISLFNYYLLTSFISGLAIACKVSSLIFIIVPLVVFFWNLKNIGERFFDSVKFILLTLLISTVFSPYNFIAFNEFLGSMKYESDVALGQYIAFYTRQFVDKIPILFQFTKIFPYVLGWPMLILFVLGFLFLSWRKKEFNLLRFAFLVYFIPSSFMFAKWTRSMAPIMPLMLIFATIFLMYFTGCITNHLKTLFFIVIILLIIPGISYLSIYKNQDVRFKASEWIYNNIPNGSTILSETANVVDIPITNSNVKIPACQRYNTISFNFYDLDTNLELQSQLQQYLATVDFIFVPSRRIFTNHQKDKYPIINNYYRKLFSGELGFKEVARFTSYPKITIFGKTIYEFSDEQAEETWTVFDHPVIRIYKKLPAN